jgi:hypothetical protein
LRRNNICPQLPQQKSFVATGLPFQNASIFIVLVSADFFSSN